MGDAPLKGQSELDVLCTLLKVSPADFARCSFLLCGSVSPSANHSCRPLGWAASCVAQREVYPTGGRGLGKGHQAYLQVPTLFLCPWYVACDLACPLTAV